MPAIDLVINFDVPRDPDDYIHRVGRCARSSNWPFCMKPQGMSRLLLVPG